VGYNTESKGYRIYWPSKNIVSVERDVYFNKDEILAPGIVQIEGETDIDTPPNPKVTKTHSSIQNMPENINNGPEPQNKTTHRKNDQRKPPEHPPPQTDSIPSSPPSPDPAPPPKCVQNDGLDEPQPGTGRGLCARRPEGFYKAYHEGKITSAAAESGTAALVDDDKLLEPGRVDIVLDNEEWPCDWNKHAMLNLTHSTKLSDALASHMTG
jgi:hypothetical protein